MTKAYLPSAPRVPTLQLPPAPWPPTADLAACDWRALPVLPPFVLADGSAPAVQQTAVRVCADAHMLYLRFDCDDRDIWAGYTRRDQPIYDEEVVELMISPGPAAPTRYYEFEVSPTGVLFDALIENPGTGHANIAVHTGWDCAGLRWLAGQDQPAGRWWAALAIPWASIGGPAQLWRANFYRIERPRDGPPEYSCWSPTMTEPADFHRPAHFGTLALS